MTSVTVESPKAAYYFGLRDDASGHFLHTVGQGSTLEPRRLMLPWTIRHLDGGLLEAREVPDEPDGRVFWTCARDATSTDAMAMLYAFVWWDRSGDERGASNSGFCVRGFRWSEHEDAFSFACEMWPKIVARQHFPLVLQP